MVTGVVAIEGGNVGENTICIPTHGLTPGAYLILLHKGESVRIIKYVVQRP